jgi:hypothetical protein
MSLQESKGRAIEGGNSHLDFGSQTTSTADKQHILNAFGEWCSKIHPDPGQGRASVSQRISAMLGARHGDDIALEREELPVFCGRNDVSRNDTRREFRRLIFR